MGAERSMQLEDEDVEVADDEAMYSTAQQYTGGCLILNECLWRASVRAVFTSTSASEMMPYSPDPLPRVAERRRSFLSVFLALDWSFLSFSLSALLVGRDSLALSSSACAHAYYGTGTGVAEEGM